MQLIEQWLGVDFSQPVEFIIAFMVVMVLIALVTLIVRGIMFRGGDGFRGRAQKRQRLFVGEWVRVDEKRRLLLVRRDDVEHLLLIGGNSDLVVEQDLTSRKPQAVAVAPAQAAPAQPDVYTPPEEPRIPTTDPGYRSPLRTGAVPAAAPVEASAATLASTPVGDGVSDTAAPEVSVEPTAGGEATNEPDTRLTGLQAARARIAALRRKSAEMSTTSQAAATGGAAVGAAVIAQSGGSEATTGPSDEPGEEPDIPAVAAVDLDEAIADALAPEISVSDDAGETADSHSESEAGVDAEDRPDAADTAYAADDDRAGGAEEPREDDLAARLHDVLIKPA